MENWQYLVGAYSVAWVGVAYFVFRVTGRQRLVEQRIADIEEKVKDR